MEYKKTLECMLCGGISKLQHKSYPGYQEPYTFQIYYCQNCDTSFSFPRVDASEIYEIIYKNGDKVPGYNRYWEYARIVKDIETPIDYLADKELTYWGVREALKQVVKSKKDARILEIGSGLGYLTYSLAKANFNVLGIDISQNAIKEAKEKFGDYFLCTDISDFAMNNPETFDIAIMTEVIEHVDKPIDFITSILKLLKPNGQIIITTPNKSFFSNEKTWESDLPPVHYWWFSEKSMNYIAKKLNTSIMFIDFINYFKIHYTAVNRHPDHKKKLPKPYFNSSGNLIFQDNLIKNTFWAKFRSKLAKIPYIKIALRKIKELNPNIIVCKNRATILCAIMEKK